MNGQAQTALPNRKGKPGEFSILLGVSAMIIAPFFLFMMTHTDEQNARMAAEGVVSQAQVKAKEVRRESYTSSKGRTRHRTVHEVNVAYDFNASTPYATWKTSGTINPSAYPAMTTQDIDVPKDWHDKLAVGEATTVVRLPTEYESLKLTAQLEREMSLIYHLQWYAGLGAAFLAGLILTIVGWRKRKAHA